MAAECIDFDSPAQSIFERKRPLATNTLRRVAKGLYRHVLACAKPYIATNTTGHSGAATAAGSNQQLAMAYLVKYYSSGGQWQGVCEPMHTIATRDRMGLVQVVQVPVDCLAPEHHERARHCAEPLREHLPSSSQNQP